MTKAMRGRVEEPSGTSPLPGRREPEDDRWSRIFCRRSWRIVGIIRRTIRRIRLDTNEI